MTTLVCRPLVAGEENVFDSLPDPLPELRQVGYADGLAGGGYRPERTWVALRGDHVVARAAWLLPPGGSGDPWLERFDAFDAETGAELLRAAHIGFGRRLPYRAALPAYWRRRPEVRAVAEPLLEAARLAGLTERGERLRCTWIDSPLPEPSGRWATHPAADAAEIRALVDRVAEPDVLTGAEIATSVAGVDLARDPLGWLTGPPSSWLVATSGGTPVGLAGTAGDACYPLLAYLGVTDPHARPDLLAAAVRKLVAEGAREVVADVDAHNVATVADLERTGFRQIRARILFTPS